MPTYTALTLVPDESNAKALGDAMERLDPEPTGVGVFEMEDGSGLWEVGGYFTETPDEAGLALLAVTFSARAFAVSELPEIDWVAKVRRELSPVEAGRFFLYGSHDADRVPEGCIPLLVDAAMAFGTGHHGTTKGCLVAFDRLLAAGVAPATVADIGCGTAVLAMAAAKALPVVPIASDIDRVAVDVAEANVALNGLAGRVICLEATGFDHPRIEGAGPYDLIFANILKGPLIALAPEMAAHSRTGGHLILSGILNPQADEVVSVYQRNGYELVERDVIGDWTTLTMRRT
ncbi:[LSU ribosomal protein L11P]-lysine N-methyltransferase [Palleronia marisminoris]|uniref:Ribosomal protein L11 methyltransferase n=1 Tax=Palleronia marisminoris TaxID=315423 RepID=A0A1Y5T267_9RHOB|nr:50S ribosomal protein L11 methyltransferase [Palleronia marisminoris]SFH14298.1 [LSU ribosomal protein L11P]-lysine N-methyltransferase [Palleronia marisminoris]SLN54214.1 Ribosomal protein L11 methyltransferase [Palleronia marisminoris]